MSDAPPPFERLLALQDHDTLLEQLHHRRDTLPERAELADAERALIELEQEVAGIQSKLDAVGRDQRRREDEVASNEAKAAEITTSMYGGTITSPKELQTMQGEIDALGRRRSTVEDEIIELMEYAEPLLASLAALGGTREALDETARVALAKIAEQETTIDAELEGVEAERAELRDTIPADVVATYEDARRSLNGVAVARLEHGTCGGCFLALPSAELDRIRHLAPDAVVHCEECGRLLVH